MTVTVREFQPTDAEAVSGLVRAALPYMGANTPEVIAWNVARAPAAQRHRLLVAELDGRVVGCGRTGLFHDSSEPGLAYVNVNVHPQARRRGVGSALLTAGESYVAGLGATTAYVWALEDDGSVAFGEKRGYRAGSSSAFQRLDLAAGPLPEPRPLPPGVELRTAADFVDDPRPLYEVDAQSIEDEPNDVPTGAPAYEMWLGNEWSRPELDRDLTTAVLVDGVVATLCTAHTDGGTRYFSAGTGTRRSYRGRGLAKLAKLDSLRRARVAGYTEAFTGNDLGNGPMLAVNKWFGYQPCATERRMSRELG
ncbi:GNAT family N-acetyltransferase [Streptomyces sp. NPDC059373]